MTLDDFYRLFDGFESTAVRLEGLPAYDVDEYEGERLRAFLAGSALPVRSVGNDAWMARLAETTAARKRWRRVRIVDEPLTDYQRFELAVYPETQAVGEEIRIVVRSQAGEVGPDVWLFDSDGPDPQMVQMRYELDGTWLGIKSASCADDIAAAADQVAHLWAIGTPLNEYLVATRA